MKPGSGPKHTRLQTLEDMTKIHESLPSGTWQRLLRALITEHVREHSATYYEHPAKATKGNGDRAEQALFKAFITDYPYWTCSFEEYRKILHEIHKANVATNTTKP